ncbi:MAG: metallophosphoesterase [Burkholderiales bacterium]|nr:metallophosphoesterase [Anaerolineae bacterium]
MTDTQLCFVHISDTHLNPDPNYQSQHAIHHPLVGAEALVRELNRLPFEPDFVLHTGDVVYDPVPAAYDLARDLLGRIPYPVYYLAGNHDEGDALQRILLEREEPLKPYHYSFEVNGVEFVCLDSNEIALVNPPVAHPAGYVGEQQLIWLDGFCSALDLRPLIVAVHHNPMQANVPWLDWMRIKNGDDLHKILLKARNRLRGVFFGHTHQNMEFVRDGIFYSGSASSWNQFHAWPGQDETIADRNALPGFNVVLLMSNGTLMTRRHTFKL